VTGGQICRAGQSQEQDLDEGECPKSGKQKALMFPSGLCNVAVREWMICHCVAHPFGAAVGRSSLQAALLEPGAGSHPPLSASVFAFAGKQKNRP